jgi:aspartate racemase
MNFAKSAHYVHNALWEEGGKYLQGKALSLERAGADSNTWHIAAPFFTKGVQIPFLHILDPTGAAIRSK